MNNNFLIINEDPRLKSILSCASILKHRFVSVWHSSFVRNVTLVVTGTAGAQAISMAFAPLITRIYGPEAFGLLGVFTALTSIVAPIAAFTYPVAIVLPRDDVDALGIARLSFFLSFVISALFAIVMWVNGNWLIRTLNAESIAAYVFLIPFVMLFSVWTQIGYQWLVRKKEFSLYARITVIQSLLLNVAKAGLGWFKPIAAVLIIVATLGNLLNAVMLFVGAKIRYRNSSDNATDVVKTPIKQLAFRHRDFPFYMTPKVVVDAVSAALPVFGLTALIGPSEAGFFTLAMSFLSMPAALIATSVEKVLYPQLSGAANSSKKLTPLVLKSALGLVLVAIWPFALIAILGPSLFEIVFGYDWREAGVYSQWLALWLFASFVIRAFYCAVPVLSIQRANLIVDIVTFCLSAIAIFAGLVIFKDAVFGVAFYAIAGTIGRVLLAALVIVSLNRFDRNITVHH